MVPVLRKELPLFTMVPVVTVTVPLFTTGIASVVLPVPLTLETVPVLFNTLVPLVLLITLSTKALNAPLLLSVPLLKSMKPNVQLIVPSLVKVPLSARDVPVLSDSTPPA